ncbi:MAG TPA: hypothetical protein VGN20_14205 [Mucilaginibacter sp.]
MIIHADLTTEATIDLAGLRRLPGIELVHQLERQAALLIFASAINPQACHELVAKLQKIPGISAVRPRYLFSSVTTFTVSTYQPRTWLL